MAFEPSIKERQALRGAIREHGFRFLRSFLFPVINTSPETGHDPAFNRRDNPAHAWVNLFVETRRAAPYITGHVGAIAYPILVVLAAVVIWA